MRCPEVENLLPLFAGDDLPRELRETVQEHLAVCSACELSRASYQSALRGLPLLREEELPAEFWKNMADGIMNRVALQAAPGQAPAPVADPVPAPRGRLLQFPPALRRLASVAAVFLLGLGFGYLFVHRLDHAPQGGSSGPVAKLTPPVAPSSEGGPSIASFQRPTAPVSTAGAGRRVYGLRDLRSAASDLARPAGGLEVITPSNDPLDAYSLEQIRTVSDDEVQVGY